jgi:hypothetical protein
MLTALTGMAGFHFPSHMIAMAACMGSMHGLALHLTMFGMFLHVALIGCSQNHTAINRQCDTQQKNKYPAQKFHHRPKT